MLHFPQLMASAHPASALNLCCCRFFDSERNFLNTPASQRVCPAEGAYGTPEFFPLANDKIRRPPPPYRSEGRPHIDPT